MAWYRIAENVLDAIANAINAKTGHTAPMTPVEMVSEIQSIPTGGTTHYVSSGGTIYFENTDITCTIAGGTEKYCNCPNLKSIIVRGPTTIQNSWIENNTNLETMILPNYNTGATHFARGNTSLTTVQLGSVGHPVTAIPSGCFRSSPSNATITIYVADDAVLPLANSPWDATYATIVYRSATTGEVVTV